MRWAVFGLSVLRTLIWPAVIFAFREQIIVLFARIIRAKVGGISVEFQEQAVQARSQLKQLRVENLPEDNESPNSSLTWFLKSESEIDLEASYVGQVIRAWARIEKIAGNLSEQLKIGPDSRHLGRPIQVRRVVEELKNRKLVPAQTVKVVQDIQKLRNRLVHEPENIGVSAAEVLLSAIKELEFTFSAISESLKSPA